MRKQEKIEVVKQLRERLERNQVILLADYRGLTVEEITELRREMRNAAVEFKVVKNRLLVKALEGSDIESLGEYLRGPVVAAFHADDPVTPARILADFAKQNEKLEIKGGAVEGDILDANGIVQLSRLPGRDQLRSTIAGQMNSLLATVTLALDGLLQEVVGLLDARANSLEEAA